MNRCLCSGVILQIFQQADVRLPERINVYPSRSKLWWLHLSI